MLATLCDLVEETKANRALCGNLLPLNNNPSILDVEGISSLTVVEDDPRGANPVAFGVFNSYTPSQVYCSVITTSPKYDNVFVNVESVKSKPEDWGVNEENADQQSLYKISNVVSELPNLSSYPQYFTAFADPIAKPLHQCVVDELINRTVGEKNFDMKRNVTVDLYDSQSDLMESSDELWRDRSGFVVGDKNRFVEVEIKRETFAQLLKESFTHDSASGIQFHKVDRKSAGLCIEYDQNLAVIDRQTFLEYLLGIHGVSGTVALDEENQPVGYVLSLNNRILQCYADSESIAHHLLYNQLQTMSCEQISLYTIAHDELLFKKLQKNADVVRRVRRFHSRIVPGNIKWNHIFALNIGVHLY